MSDKLPRGWVWGTIGEVAIVNPTTRKASIPDDLNVSFVPMAAVTEVSGRINLSDIRTARVLKPKGYRSFVDGDVLVAKITPSMENGKAAVARRLENSIGFGSTEFHVLRPLETMFAEYLFYYVVRESFRSEAARAMTGTAGQLRVPPDFLRTAPIPIAPPAEQKRIVAAIEEHFSRLDAAERALTDARRKLKSLQRSAALQLIDPARWISTTLGDVADVFVGSTPSRTRPDLWLGPIPWVSSGEIQFCRIMRTREHIAAEAVQPHRIHPPGTVLLGMIGEGKTRCQAAVLEIAAAHSQNSAAIRPERSALSSDWLFHLLRVQYESNRRIGSGNNQPALNKARVRELRIPLPPLAEQNRLVGQLDDAAAILDQADTSLAQAQSRCDALRRTVLTEAFAGRLVLQDPEDEPASALLDRIAASQPAKPARRRART